MPDAVRRLFDLQGHRGARGLLPENTIPAFRRALELGVTTLEMDVVISKDGKVVVSHDPHFDPAICSWPDGRPITEPESHHLRLFEMTYDEIKAFDCGRRGNPAFPRQKPTAIGKPLLSAVIAMAESAVKEIGRPPIRYNIETKSRKSGDGVLHPSPRVFTELLYSVLTDFNVLDRSTIQSFDVRTLRVARDLNPDWTTSLLVSRSTGRFVTLQVRRLGFLPHIYSPDYRTVSGRMIRRAHGMGMEVIPWTVNDATIMLRLAKLGVDGLITDYPDVAKPALERFLTN